VLAIAGIGSGDAVRRTVLERVGEAASRAQACDQITARRGGQIARHVRRALERSDVSLAA
jgi:hypothetical protein